MPTEETLYREQDGIAIIEINRPEKKNTLTNSVIQGIEDGIDRASRAKDASARPSATANGPGATMERRAAATRPEGSAWRAPRTRQSTGSKCLE